MGLAFTYLMTYGGSLVALFNPWLGLLIYICFAIIRPDALWYWSVTPGNYSRIIAISLLIGWTFRGFGDWRLGRAWPIILCLMGYFGWAILSATQAINQEFAWEYIEKQSKIVLPVVVGISLIDSAAKLKQLTWVIVLSHGYISYSFNMSYWSGFNRLQEIGFGGADNNCVGIALVTCIGLGGFLVLAAERWWQKGLALVSVAFMVHAVLISMSRGAMLGLIVVAGVAFLLIPKRPAHYLAMAAGILITLQFAGQQVTERFGTAFADEEKRDASAESRMQMWQICIDQTLQHPVIGLGPHHFPVYAQSFGLTPGKEAHTTWLQTASELGLPGASLLLLYYILCIIRLWPVRKDSCPVPDPWIRDTARMVTASMAGFMFTAQFVTLPGLEAPYYIAMLGAGALKLLPAPGSWAGPDPRGIAVAVPAEKP